MFKLENIFGSLHKEAGEDKTNTSEEQLVDYGNHEVASNEMFPEGYLLLLDENSPEWKKEDVEKAKNEYSFIKEKLPSDFKSKSYEERMEIVKKLLNS